MNRFEGAYVFLEMLYKRGYLPPTGMYGDQQKINVGVF